MARLEIQHVSKSFGSVHAVQDVSFAVGDGVFTALLGPSGCGKTTLLRIIAGFTHPDGGRVLVDGSDIGPLPPEKRRMGLVFQNYALFPHLTVAENIAYGLRARRVPRQAIRAKVTDALKLVRLEGLGGRKPSEISGGQQQRVALARALVIEPDILLLDEPLSALDRAIRVEMQAELRRIQHEVGITTVFVTHDQEEALTLADQVIVLRDGVLQQRGSPEDLYLHPANQFVSAFLGAANTVTGVIEPCNGQWAVRHDDVLIPVMPRDGFQPGDRVETVIRPEWLSIKPEDEGGASAFSARIVAVRFAGPTSEITIRSSDLELRVLSLFAAEGLRQGQEVAVTVERHDLPLYHLGTRGREI